MPFYSRKNNRLPGYDYSTENYYFITICTHNKKCIFGDPNYLNSFGKIAENCILEIPNKYQSVRVDNYVVMPNHIHLILVLEQSKTESPCISNIIGQYKMSVTKQIHKIALDIDVWQRSFHDHIIRNQKAYEKIWNYVEYNDQKWTEDCFYCEEF